MKNFQTLVLSSFLVYLAACSSPGTPVVTPTNPSTPEIPSVPENPSAPQVPVSLSGIEEIAVRSSCASTNLSGKGRAPAGYLKGMALTFAKSLCRYKKRDIAGLVMADRMTGNPLKDVLTYYASDFSSLGMSNDTESSSTLRHLYSLAIGLGMRESDGLYCEGRDMSASNVTSDTAEAGIFQTSWNAASASSALPKLFSEYQGEKGCFLEYFKQSPSASCTSSRLSNYGSGNGKEFQRLSKACPAFATEFAMVVLRTRRNHYGPINRKEAKISQVCDSMFAQIEKAVNDNPNICGGLL
jgi:hypothetical protein